jgi:hypothetical protein
MFIGGGDFANRLNHLYAWRVRIWNSQGIDCVSTARGIDSSPKLLAQAAGHIAAQFWPVERREKISVRRFAGRVCPSTERVPDCATAP